MVSDDKDKNPHDDSDLDEIELSMEDDVPDQGVSAQDHGFAEGAEVKKDKINTDVFDDIESDAIDADEVRDDINDIDVSMGAVEVSEFDEIDVDVDITGDEDIDFGEDAEELSAPKRRMIGAESGGVKRFLLPGLVLLGAACVGGYMILMPTVNNANISPSAVVIPPPANMAEAENDLSAPFEPADVQVADTAQTSDVDAFVTDPFNELPQPTVTQNTPLIPVDESEPTLVEEVATLDTTEIPEGTATASLDVVTQENVEITAESDFGVAESNIMEAPLAEDAEITMVETPAPETDSFAPDNEVLSEGVADETVATSQPSADFPILSEADFPPEPVRVAQNDITEPVAVETVEIVPEETSSGLLPDDALSAPVEDNMILDNVSQDPLAAASGTANDDVDLTALAGDGPQVYFEAAPTRTLPPTGAGASIGPRKVDPVVEPAAQYIVVNKTSQANDFEARLVAARRALNLERYDAAQTLYTELAEKNPRDPRVLMGLAVAQQKSGMTDVALQTYERLLDVDDDNPEALSNMLGLIRSQYPAVAARRLVSLYEKNPSSPAIAAQLGVVNGELGDYENAIKYLGIAASLQPENPLHYFNMAIIAERARQSNDAIRYYERALEVDAIYGGGRSIDRDVVYKRLSTLRRR